MMSRQNRATADSNQIVIPPILMLASSLCYSGVPLLLVRFGGDDSPFFFNAIYRFGGVIGALTFLGLFFRVTLLNKAYRSIILEHVLDRSTLLVILPYFSFTAFAWSITFIDVSLTTVMLEIWPVLFILFTERLMRREKRYRTPTTLQILLVMLGFVGFTFVVFSQVSSFDALSTLDGGSLAGIALALIAALLASSTAYNYRWAADLTRKLQDHKLRESRDDDSARCLVNSQTSSLTHDYGELTCTINRESMSTDKLLFFCLLIAFVFGSAISAIFNFIPSILMEGDNTFSEIPLLSILAAIIIGGVLLDAGGTVLNRTANLLTRQLGINAIGYTTPIFALIWLFIFSETNVVRVDYLVIGTAAILATNILINFEAERLIGFKALVISLWVFGMLIYFRDPDKWQWAISGPEYFDALILSATVFTLILSFRVARLASRIQEEDNRTIALVRILTDLSDRGVISREVCDSVLTMSVADGADLESSYDQAKRHLRSAMMRSNRQMRDSLLQAETELDILAHSRQQGLNFGEICALFIFTGLVVGLAILSRPEVSGLTGFLIEMFAILFAAVIIFLTVSVFDLQRDRDTKVLHRTPKMMRYGVLFQDHARRMAERWISIVAGFLIVIAYAILLGYKWMCVDASVECTTWWQGILKALTGAG